MEITQEQYCRIEPELPRQRGNVSLSNLTVLNAILYVAEQGCKWRGLPKRFGNWHTIYTRMNRWSKNGVLDAVFEKLQREQLVRIRVEAVSMDSTIVKVHPDGTGALKKTVRKRSANPSGGWTTKIHLVAANARTAITFALSPGQAHDAPQGRDLLARSGATTRAATAADGPRLPGRPDPPIGSGFWVDSRRAAQAQPPGAVGIRPRSLPPQERSREALPPTQRFPAYLLPFR